MNQESAPTTPHKLGTGTNPSVSNLRVLFCPCVVQKETALIDTKAPKIHHKPKKGSCGIFVGIPQHQKRLPLLRT